MKIGWTLHMDQLPSQPNLSDQDRDQKVQNHPCNVRKLTSESFSRFYIKINKSNNKMISIIITWIYSSFSSALLSEGAA